MNAVNTQQSIHDRKQHEEFLRDQLGHDLFTTKKGEPRKIIGDKHTLAKVTNGSHPNAQKAYYGLRKFLPHSSRNGEPRWNSYAVLAPPEDHMWTRTPTDKQGRRQAPVAEAGNWLKHLLLRTSILPGYANETEFDSLLIDVDVEIGGERQNLHSLSDEERIAIFEPWVDAVSRIQQATGEFRVEWMLSGGKGFWVQVFFEKPGTRGDARRIRQAILCSLDTRVDLTKSQPIAYYDDIIYTIDKDNLGRSVCRIPWSMHQSTQNVSINIDPETGQPDLFQFADTPPNSGSLSDFALRLPSHLFDRRVFSLLDDDEAIEVLPPEEVQRLAQQLFSQLERLDPSSGFFISEAEAGSVCPEEQGSALHRTEDEERDHICRDITGPNADEEENHALAWGWEDVVREAEGASSITSWRDLVVRDALDGEKHNRIVRSGNLLLVAAAMKGEKGYVDWDELIAEYEAAYADADFSNGGTIRDWVRSLRKGFKDGKDIRPFRPGLTKDEIEACGQLAQSTIGGLPPGRRPSADELFHVLLCLRRLLKAAEEKEIDEDYLARRSGINPYPTWEKQKAAEFDENDGKYMNDGKPIRPRDYPTSANARKKVARLLHLICDMDGQPSGTKPFVRTKRGVPKWESETGRGQGSIYRRVESHPFWSTSLMVTEDTPTSLSLRA